MLKIKTTATTNIHASAFNRNKHEITEDETIFLNQNIFQGRQGRLQGAPSPV